MDANTQRQLDILLDNVRDDWDFTIIISAGGEVRSGKSLLALQIATYWVYELEKRYGIKVPFTEENVIFNWQKLIETGHKLGQKYHYSPIIYDEAGETMEGAKVATREMKQVKDFFRECGQYNFLNIIVLPEFFDLPKSISLTRSTCLFDVYYTSSDKGKFKRGYYKFYSRKAKKSLYIAGKKYLNYNAAPYNFQGRFFKFYPIDEERYREKKNEAFLTRGTNFANNSNLTLGCLVNELDLSIPKIWSLLWDKYGIKIGAKTLETYKNHAINLAAKKMDESMNEKKNQIKEIKDEDINEDKIDEGVEENYDGD